MSEPTTSLVWRVTVLEREVQSIKAGRPEVVADRVENLALRVTELKNEINEDMTALRSEMRERDGNRERQIRGFQRIFVAVFSGVGIAVSGAVVAIVLSGGGP